MTKKCNVCLEMLPVEMFHVRNASQDGLAYTCKECARIRNKRLYNESEDRKNKVKDRAKVWAKKNRERRREIVREYGRRNRSAKTAYARKWRTENSEKAKAYGRFAQAKRRASGKISIEEWQEIANKTNGVCVYCGELSQRLTMDHVDPVSVGGKTEGGNLIPCCATCNFSKNDSDVADWLYEKYGVEGLARAILFLEQGVIEIVEVQA